MNKKILIVTSIAILFGSVTMLPKTTEAYQGNPNVKGPNYSEQRHEAMEKAFEKKDYNAWKNLMQGRGRVTQVINEKNFAKFAYAHELAEQGKLQEAQKIRLELGLGQQNGLGINRAGWNK